MRKSAYRKMRIGLLTVLLLFSLTACNDGEDSIVNKKGTKKEQAKSALMVVGNESVSYEEAFAYIYMLKQQYEPGMGENIWDFQVEEGVTFEEYAKEKIVDELTQLKIICQEAEKLEIALDEDEIQEAKNMASDFMATVSEEDAHEYYLTEERMASVYEDHILAEKVYEIATNEVDTNIPDEEAKQITVQYLAVMTNRIDKNGNKVEMTAEEKKQAKKRAKTLYKEALDLDSSFYAFADANSDAKEVEITFGKNNMPEDFGEAAMELKSEKMSKLITGENGYYIIYCVSDYDEDATLAKKEEIISSKQDELFRQKYAEWSKGYKLIISTALWNEITF